MYPKLLLCTFILTGSLISGWKEVQGYDDIILNSRTSFDVENNIGMSVWMKSAYHQPKVIWLIVNRTILHIYYYGVYIKAW